MPSRSSPAKVPLAPTPEGTSEPLPDAEDAQLSSPGGVHSNVSSVAMDRGLLAMAGVPSQAERTFEADQPDEGLSDARHHAAGQGWRRFSFRVSGAEISPAHGEFHVSAWRTIHAAAEDLAQEVFLRVYRSRENYEASAKFTTWLYRIASNLAVNHARDTRHERPENTVSLDEPDQDSGLTMDMPDERRLPKRRLSGGSAWPPSGSGCRHCPNGSGSRSSCTSISRWIIARLRMF